jgi:hypothetical protein
VRVELAGLPDDAPELVLSRLLDEYRDGARGSVRRRVPRAQAAAGLLVVGLQQRLLSSIEAFARSLKVHRATVERSGRTAGSRDTAIPTALERDQNLFLRADSDDDRSDDTPEEADADDAAQVESITTAAEREGARRRRRLSPRARAARPHAGDRRRRTRPAGREDARAGRLDPQEPLPRPAALGKSVTGAPPKWNNRRVLIFTENREGTKAYLKHVLELAIEGTDCCEDRIAVIDGLTSRENRREIQRRFNTPPAKDPLRILLATDAAREGLNFQAHCTDLFHFDLPWNPGRIEQRNGRIDRKLQPRPKCAATTSCCRSVRRTAFSRSWSQDGDDPQGVGQPGEGHRRRHRAPPEAGHSPQGRRAPGQGVSRRSTSTQSASASPRTNSRRRAIASPHCRSRSSPAANSSSARANGPASTRTRSARRCRARSSCSAPKPLRKKPGSEREPGLDVRIRSTALPRRTRAGPRRSTRCAPRRKRIRIADWRREAPIRPVTFKDAGVLTEETVHLHLEQRVAQRLLARFRAQGFVYHDLSRACLAQAATPSGASMLLGRCRSTARAPNAFTKRSCRSRRAGSNPSQRKGTLTAYAREAEALTLACSTKQSWEGARPCSTTGPGEAPRFAAPRDIEELLPQLEPRADELAASDRAKLAKRGEREEKDLRDPRAAARSRPRQSSRSTRRKFKQLTLGFDDRRDAPARSDMRRGAPPRTIRPDLASRSRQRMREFYEVTARSASNRSASSTSGRRRTDRHGQDRSRDPRAPRVARLRPADGPRRFRAGAGARGRSSIDATRGPARSLRGSERARPSEPARTATGSADFEGFARSRRSSAGVLAPYFAGTSDSPIPDELVQTLPQSSDAAPGLRRARSRAPAEPLAWQLLVRVLEPGQVVRRRRPHQRSSRPRSMAAWSAAAPDRRAGGLSCSTAARCVCLGAARRERGLDRLPRRVHGADRLAGRSRMRCADPRRTTPSQPADRASASSRCSRTAASTRTRSASASPSRFFTGSTSCFAAFRPPTTATKERAAARRPAEHPDQVYRALLTVTLRLVFLLYAEERDMLPDDETFLRYYSLAACTSACARTPRSSRTRWTSASALGPSSSRSSA